MQPAKTMLFLLILAFMGLKMQAKIIVVNAGENLNAIINGAKGADTILVKAGTYSHISVSDKFCSEQKPLIVRSDGSGTVLIKGDTISRGSALELNNCSYVVIEGLTFTNSRWGIYVKNSSHIILKENEIYYTGQEGSHIGRSSKYVDLIGNKIYNTGHYNSKWAEGIYIGSGSYGGNNKYPDNCEYIWVENNHIYETGKAEGINVKGECFHVTVRNNRIHDIHPGTSEQHNEAAITVEGTDNSISKNYRLSEKRDVWIENNTISNVSGGYSDWNNGIMFFGTGVYILNNTISNCTNRGIYGNNWKNIDLQNYVFGNSVSNCSPNMSIHPALKVIESDPGKNPHSPQTWYTGF